MGKFVIKQNNLGYTFSLKAPNGEIIATGGEVFNSLQACKNSINSVITNAPTAGLDDTTAIRYYEVKCPKFEIYRDKKGEYRFRLKASNGEPILASEGYTAKSGCKAGIDSVRKNVANAEITDSE